MKLLTENTNHWNVLFAMESNKVRTLVLGNNMGEVLICNIDNETPMITFPADHSPIVKIWGEKQRPLTESDYPRRIEFEMTEDTVSPTKLVFPLDDRRMMIRLTFSEKAGTWVVWEPSLF